MSSEHPITVQHINQNYDFENLRQEWDELLQHSPLNDAFLTWEWLFTWWKHFGENYQLWLLTARQNGLLMGIAPLMLAIKRPLGIKLRVLSNMGVPPPDVGGIIVRDGSQEVLLAFGEYLARERQSWDVLSICEIPAEKQEIDALERAFPTKGFITRIDTSRHFVVPIQQDWESYYQSLSRNLRDDLKKNKRRMEKRGKVIYRRFIGSQATQDHMYALFTINKLGQHPHLYQTSIDTKEFHLDLAKIMAERGWLDLSFLYLDEKPVAFMYGFLYQNCFEAWRIGFNAEYSELSVGKMVLFFLLEDCFRRQVHELHFLRGGGDYKARWQVTERIFVHPCVVQNRLPPLLFYVWIPAAKRRLRQQLEKVKFLSLLVYRYDKWRGNK
jgi:CelD/BcsL family acetyltransferase involved in cellulose biosynthesis